MKLVSLTGYTCTCTQKTKDTDGLENELLIEGIQKINQMAARWIEIHPSDMTIQFVFSESDELVVSFLDSGEFEEFCKHVGEIT